MESSSTYTRKRKTPVEPRQPAVLTAKFSNQGGLYVTGGKDNLVSIWKYPDGRLLGAGFEHSHEVRDVCFKKDDSLLASCDAEGIYMYDLQAVRPFGRFVCYRGVRKNEVNAIQLYESGSVIVSAGSSVHLWDVRSSFKKPMQTFDTFEARITSLCLRGRTEIIAGCLDGSVQKFDLRNDTRLSLDLGSPVKCISMGNRGTCIVASRQDSTLQLLHVKTDSIRKGVAYTGHTCQSSRSKLGCSFTKDTTHVVGGSEDGRVFIWDLVSQEVVSQFEAHSAAVTCVDYHPTDDSLLSASMDGSVVLWKDEM